MCLSGMLFGEAVCWDLILPMTQFRKKAMKMNEGNIQMRFQVSSAERMANWRWPSTESAYVLLMCACMCLYLICSLCCPALTWNLSFKSPCFREDYISALKPAETAFLTLLQGKSRVRNKRKQSTLKVPESVCTDSCPVDITESLCDV